MFKRVFWQGPAPHSMQDLSPLQWEYGVLTTGQPRKSLNKFIFEFTIHFNS